MLLLGHIRNYVFEIRNLSREIRKKLSNPCNQQRKPCVPASISRNPIYNRPILGRFCFLMLK